MTFARDYLEREPARDAVDAGRGWQLLEFGTPWCGHCIAAQPLLQKLFGAHPRLVHLKIEDGKGRALGRSFAVKLWPTLILLHDGAEVARAVRPRQREDLLALTAALDAGA